MADIKAAFNTPFKEAIDFFGNKIKLPTSGYTDIWREQHSHAFVVAGAANDALVVEMRFIASITCKRRDKSRLYKKY